MRKFFEIIAKMSIYILIILTIYIIINIINGGNSPTNLMPPLPPPELPPYVFSTEEFNKVLEEMGAGLFFLGILAIILYIISK